MTRYPYLIIGGGMTADAVWNVWGQVEAARALIADRGPIRADQLRGRLPA